MDTKLSTKRKSERNRQRFVQSAQEFFKKSLTGRFNGKAAALRQIAAAKRPMVTAKHLVAQHQTQIAVVVVDDLPDHSDVQELYVKLFRKHGMVDQPHSLLLKRMGRRIAENDLDREEFARLSGVVMGMPCVVPKAHRWDVV